MTLEELAARVEAATGPIKWQRNGTEFKARCPVHQEQTASATFKVGSKGGIIAYCFGCASKGDKIAEALGIDIKEFFAQPLSNGNGYRNGSNGRPAQPPAMRPQTAQREPPAERAPLRNVKTTRYRIRDSERKLIAVHVRLDGNREDGTPAKRMWWELPDGTKDLGPLKTADLPLYRSELVAEEASAEMPIVVEGEKDCQALSKRGLPAVGTVCGAAATPSDETLRPLVRFASITLWPDDDPPPFNGQRHMDRIAAALKRLGAKEVRVVEVAGRGQGEGAADFSGDDDALRALIEAARPFTPTNLPAIVTDNPWSAAREVDDFLSATDLEASWLVPNILARESITVLSSPRGLGKTHFSYWIAIDLARRGFRGLIIDRDNPKREIKRRLKAWGAAGLADKLKIIARDEAPPLTDKAAWAAFPYSDYDFVILDSISVATEGVEEKDGGKAGAGLAPLLDAARRGPAVLLLANTTKDALKVRGSGTLSDRADIIFEIRDATDLKVEPRMQAWWDALPNGAEDAWAERAKRRRRRDSYRLALVTSKFRLGEEPNPMAFEVRHDTDPWSASEVTSEVEQQLEDVKRQAADAEQAKIDLAVKALKAVLPLRKNPDEDYPDANNAEDLLVKDHRFSRSAARRLIKLRMDLDWIQVGSGKRGDRFILKLPAGNGAARSPSQTGSSEGLFPAGTGTQGRQESMFKNATAPRDSEPSISGGSLSFNGNAEDGLEDVESDDNEYN